MLGHGRGGGKLVLGGLKVEVEEVEEACERVGVLVLLHLNRIHDLLQRVLNPCRYECSGYSGRGRRTACEVA